MPNPLNTPRRVLFVDDDRSIRNLFQLVLASGSRNTTQRTRRLLDAHLTTERERVDRSPTPQAPAPHALAFVDIQGPNVCAGEMIDRMWRAAPELQVVICSAPKSAWGKPFTPAAHNEGMRVLHQPFECIEVLVDRETRAEMADLKQRLVSRTVQLEETRRRLDDEHQERQRMEAELRLAQKLESVGQLAAGVAHEISSPLQYVGDSVQFLERSFRDLLSAVASSQECISALAATGTAGADELTSAARRAAEVLDAEYLQKQVPRALERALEGLERVSSIVQAMREFAHPDAKQKTPADLNRAMESTLTVCRNEYKHVADIHAELGALPLVECHVGAINQVFLNLIVNAAHAVRDAVGDSGRKGIISIRTRTDGRVVVISIEDSGTGIPEDIRDRVFDPFFTTKPVGKGTGQGLAIARSIVVDKHGGRLTFESRVGRGTRFDVELPVAAADGLEPP